MKRFYWFLFAVCLLSRRFRLKGKRRGITVGRWRGISLSMRSFVSEFFAIHAGDSSFEGLSVTGIYNWRCCRWNWTPQTCDWYLNVGVGGALGLYDFDDSGFCSVWPAPALSAVISKCPDLFGGRLPSCDRSCDRRWT